MISQISKTAVYQIDKNNYQNDNSKSVKEIMFQFPLEIERLIYEYAVDTDKFNNCINELNSEIKYCDENDSDAFHAGFHDYILDKLHNRINDDDESDIESEIEIQNDNIYYCSCGCGLEE